MNAVRPLRAYAEVRLGRQRSPEHAHGPFMVPYLRAANVTDGKLVLDDVLEMNFAPEEQTIYALRAGDVLVTEGSGSLRSVGATAVWNEDRPGLYCFQNTLLRLRPRLGTDPRFLAWWCRHAFASGAFASIATGANIFHLSAERVRSLPMTYVPPDEQRMIADFLERETARIDKLMAMKRRMQAAITERLGSALESTLEAVGRPQRIRFLSTKIGSGKTPAGGSDTYLTSGVAFLRSQNILDGRVDLSDVAFVSADVDYEMAGTRVRPGDVLLNITGASIGRCAVFRAPVRANVNQHVCIIRPRNNVSGSLVQYAIRTRFVQEQIREFQVGGNRDGLNFDQVGNLTVMLPEGIARQSAIAEELGRTEALHQAGIDALDDQLRLLAERRQALITSAVTGRVPMLAAT